MSEDWQERWREGRIGWHQPGGHPGLRRHWPWSGRRVLVPLCGKAADLCWLAERGNAVVGVELSELAVESFFAEQGLQYVVEKGPLAAYRATALDITIYRGDYFELDIAPCDAHFDRGALIAMPPEKRPAYVEKTDSLLTDDALQLVITVDYDQAVVAGPPFSVGDDELLGYWPNLRCIEIVDDLSDAPPKFIDAGLEAMAEKIWRSP